MDLELVKVINKTIIQPSIHSRFILCRVTRGLKPTHTTVSDTNSQIKCMCVERGRKMEYRNKTHTQVQEKCANSTQKGRRQLADCFEPERCCEASARTTCTVAPPTD